MKKTITLLCAFILAISFNSCGGSDDSSDGSDADKIVGNWKYVGDIYLGVFEPNTNESCDDEFIKFSSNNTGRYTEKYCDEADEVYPFTWEKTADPIYNYIFTDNDSGISASNVVVFSADFEQLTVYQTEEDMLDEDAGEVFQKQ